MKLVTTFNLPSYTFYAQLVKINKLRRVKKFELGIEGVLNSRNCFSLSEQREALDRDTKKGIKIQVSSHFKRSSLLWLSRALTNQI